MLVGRVASRPCRSGCRCHLYISILYLPHKHSVSHHNPLRATLKSAGIDPLARLASIVTPCARTCVSLAPFFSSSFFRRFQSSTLLQSANETGDWGSSSCLYTKLGPRGARLNWLQPSVMIPHEPFRTEIGLQSSAHFPRLGPPASRQRKAGCGPLFLMPSNSAPPKSGPRHFTGNGGCLGQQGGN